jgi:hypothetical protein
MTTMARRAIFLGDMQSPWRKRRAGLHVESKLCDMPPDVETIIGDVLHHPVTHGPACVTGH